MHCNSCIKNIEGNISVLSGVKKIEVSLEEKEGKIMYSPKQTNGKELATAIEEMGFETSLKRIVDVLTQHEISLSEDGKMDNKEIESLENCCKNSNSEVKISVKGMTCHSCVKTIEQGMSDQPGVQAVNVSLKNEEAVITYDASLTDPGKLREAIDDMGFEASLSSSSSPPVTNDVQAVMINIDGMTCNSCVQTIEKNISQLDGIQSISVSLAAKTAQVRYSPGKITAEQAREAIEDMGFDASLIGDGVCSIKVLRLCFIAGERM